MNSHAPSMSFAQGLPGLGLGLLWGQVREEHGCEPPGAQGAAPRHPLVPEVVQEAVSMSYGSTAPHVSKIHTAQFRNMKISVKLTRKM